MQEKRYTVAVTRELHTKFRKLCRTNNLIGLKVIRALVQLYVTGDVDPLEAKVPEKPYKIWLQLLRGTSDHAAFAKDLDRMRSRMKEDEREEVSAVVRGLVLAFVSRQMTATAWDYVVASAQRRKRLVSV